MHIGRPRRQDPIDPAIAFARRDIERMRPNQLVHMVDKTIERMQKENAPKGEMVEALMGFSELAGKFAETDERPGMKEIWELAQSKLRKDAAALSQTQE